MKSDPKPFARFDSVESSTSSGSVSSISLQGRPRSLWRPSSLVNLVSPRKKNRVLQSSVSTDRLYELGTRGLSEGHSNKSKRNGVKSNPDYEKGGDTIVNIILVEAKNLPEAPSDGFVHSLYCTLRVGSETYESKSVSRTKQPEWMEKLRLTLKQDSMLAVTLWNEGSQRNVMGSCVIDLSKLDKNQTNDIWEELDQGLGTIHLKVSLCSTLLDHEQSLNFDIIKEKLTVFTSEWNEVGTLKVNVVGAKGLSGKPSAYCKLEMVNERVQTPSVRGTSEPVWNQDYEFKVYDITSTIDVAVYDSSIIKAMRDECVGQVTIPLLRIKNGETRWYALKNRTNRDIISGNCPKILLEFHLVWNPLKASLKLFQPKEEKKSKRSFKFKPDDVYHNVVALGTIMNMFNILNDHIIKFLEWENKELNTVVLLGWFVFWYHFEWWMLPLIMLLPFIYYWIPYYLDTQNRTKNICNLDDDPSFLEFMTGKNNDLADKVTRAPETAVTIKKSVDFIIINAERVHNLLRFKVPFLSYFVMIALVALSFAIHYVQFKHFMIAFGILKYIRKYLHPERECSNDLINFLSRIPDNKTVKNWKELKSSE